ncbi:MAG: Hsp70 family protein, partial [Bacteroidota bacterium]
MSVVLGIDLGTTNSAVAYVEAGQPIRFFEVPQLVAASEVAERPGLPSFLYLPGPYDLPEGATNLPWTHERAFAVGEFARARGAEVPGRLVSSAKSWLVHERVDRTKAILPWNADDEVEQLSPVEASRRYLDHLREAWNHAHPDQPMERQPLVLTVPASFDEAARELTVRAARLAGLGHAVLLEEPLAAFYAWVSEREHTWQDQLQPGDLVLVCDIGGGTTDFSIIGVSEGEDGPELDRLAVGDHLMLGGDNMDFAVGRHLETQLMGAPGRLDPRRWNQLVFLSRQAKEAVLGTDDEGAQYEVAIAG